MGMHQQFLRGLTHHMDEYVHYTLETDTSEASLNNAIGDTISISHSGLKQCVHCGRKVKKIYNSGYCYPCLTTLAECDLCIVKPHECHHHLGTCRDDEFADQHCMIPHFVYLAYSSHVKVGLTRKGRQFTRWVDQGASAAILVAEVPTRKQAGELEVEIGTFLSDKTDWRKMLTTELDENMDEKLRQVKQEVFQRVSAKWEPHLLQDEDTVHHFIYPRQEGFSPKLTSLSLDKTPQVEGVLRGIKGQYLLFDHGVFNVKKHAGYGVEFKVVAYS